MASSNTKFEAAFCLRLWAGTTQPRSFMNAKAVDAEAFGRKR